MDSLAASSFLLLSTILVGMLNLLAPFATKEDSKIRSFLLISISGFFLLNVIIIDFLFINGTEISFTILELDKYSIAFSLEPLGLIFLNLISVLWAPALLYTIKFLSVNNINNSSRFLFFTNSALLCGCFVAISANLISMFIAYEILTISTIPLIIHQYTIKNLKGLFRYLNILMVSGLLLFLPAIIIIYSKAEMGAFVNGGFIRSYFTDLEAICLLLAFIFGVSKASIFPLHGWLPAAMVASYPVSALLHAVVVVKTGLFCLYKIIFYIFGLGYLQYLFASYNWIIFFPIVTLLYSAISAIMAREIKMLLAYSTINQLSIALLSAFMFTSTGLKAAVIHMVSHAFTKICLFYAAGSFYILNRTYQISQLKGIAYTMPKVSLIMVIGCLSLMGMPPFAGFFSKFYIIAAAADSGNSLVIAVLNLSTILTSIYIIRILIVIYSPLKSSKELESEKTLPVFIFISLGICLVGVVCFAKIKNGIILILKVFEGNLASIDYADMSSQAVNLIITSVIITVFIILIKKTNLINYFNYRVPENYAKESWSFNDLEDQIFRKITSFHNQPTAIFAAFLLIIAMISAFFI